MIPNRVKLLWLNLSCGYTLKNLLDFNLDITLDYGIDHPSSQPIFFENAYQVSHSFFPTGEPRRVLIPFMRYGRPKKYANIIFLQQF